MKSTCSILRPCEVEKKAHSAIAAIDNSPYLGGMNELLGLPYSPWTEKARWALDVRKVPYRFRHYQPLIGEPALRLKTRRLFGVVSVPVLTDSRGRIYDDSSKIAQFADAHGEGPSLFPPQHQEALSHWTALSERGLDAGRTLSLHRQLHDEEALTELVPGKLRRQLGTLAPRIGAAGLRRTLRKYDARGHSLNDHRITLCAALDELRETLGRSGASPKTVLDTFSYADIAASQVLSFVSPPSFGLKLGKASARGFTYDKLAEEYADLVAWRDALYEAYRPREA